MIYQVVNILETRILKKIENFKTSLIKSDLCEYSDACIVAKTTIFATGTNNANRSNKKRTFKDNAPFRS